MNQVHDDNDRFSQLLQQVRLQVRVAVKTQAGVLTNPDGHLLQFDQDGPLAGVKINLDGPFAYQYPMPLFQTGQQLWPISSVSVKECLATLVANENLHPSVNLPVALDSS